MGGNRTRRQGGANRRSKTASPNGCSRRAVLGAVGSAGIAGIAGCLGFGDDGDDGDDSDTNDTDDSSPAEGPEPALPTVEGPIEGGSRTGGPQTAAPHDLEAYDYVEEEYFLAGDARHDDFFIDGEQAEDTAEFKTRILVYRPRQAENFNGSVYAEWLNVTTQVDAPVAWPNAYESLMHNGTAVALVSAQKVGVDGSELDMDLTTWDPERYGSLSHPGDEYALDIFAQAVNALVQPGQESGESENDDPDPMGGLEVENALATGHSQSAFFLLRYINMVVQTYGLLDGFVPAGSPLTTALADQRPILWLNSEDEVGGLATFTEGSDAGDVEIPQTGLRAMQTEPGPRDDEGQFRLWEVAGASHVNVWLSLWTNAVQRRDFEDRPHSWSPMVAGQYGERPETTYGECQANYFPARFAWRSALERLRVWVEDGEEPPAADRIARTTDDEGNPTVERDDDGNAVGGLRLPTIDVPVATYEGSACGLTGRTIRFDESTLAERYPSHQDYVDAIAAANDAAVERGHLRERDAAALLQRAEASPVGGD
jgi:hypothetical protein